MATIQHYSTLSELWHGGSELLLLGEKHELKFTGMTAYIFDPILCAESLEYEMDLSVDLWLTKGRFTGLQRDYIDPPSLKFFIEQAAAVDHKRPQIAQMQCRKKGQRHVSYKWGNCVLAFTFRKAPTPVLTMFSRTSMITRIGGLDLALAHCIGKEIAEARGDDVKEYGFTWHLSSLQHSSLQAVPYFHSQGWLEELEEYTDKELEEVPALKAMKRQLAYFDDLDRRKVVSKLGTRRRVREQRREFIEGRMKRTPVPLSELNLDKIKEVWE